MTISRPAVLGVGDEVRLAGRAHTVVALTGGDVHLEDVTGRRVVQPLGKMLAHPSMEVTSAVQQRLPVAPEGLLGDLPEDVVAQARWWERHLGEVLRGRDPEAPRDAAVKPEYDPATRSLRQRELAKVAELGTAGHQVALSTLQRMRRAYEREGLLGLVDGRHVRAVSVTGRTDARVIDALRRAVDAETDKSTGTGDRLRRRVEQILAAEHGEDAPALPSRATFYRLVERLTVGKHTLGSARTRRSLAKQPSGPFGTVASVRPGEWMQIDSTPLDVRVVLDNGVVDRVELTWMIDAATRGITAAVLRPSTKAPDAALLLARTLTPEPMRPGWADALRMSRSVLPHRRLTELDERLQHAAARPVIAPETIVCDHGGAYVSLTFRSACRSLGINFQPTLEGSPWQKGIVERSFDSVGTLFAQYVAGYVGSSVEHRGENAEAGATWSMVELQALLDEWIVAVWQNRPHDGLRHPVMPARALTPNEQYAAMVEAAGYVPVPLAPDDYIELLPATWRTINSYGVRINHRVYDCKGLNPYRRQHSGVSQHNGLWEVHRDPYDVSRIWVRNHHDGGWLTVPWTHLRSSPVPFGEQAWDYARKMLARRGEDAVTEREIANAASALIDRAETGRGIEAPQMSRREQRVAGRTRATAPPTWPQQEPEPETVDETTEDPADVDDGSLAEVIPLGVYDARKEAETWW